MADTSIAAHAFPQDDGTGVPDGSEDYDSAGFFGLLARSAGSEHAANGLAPSNVDATNEQTDITAGHAYLSADQQGASVQSGSQTAYDVGLPAGSDMTYVVVLPSDVVDLALDADAVNDVYLYVDPSQNDAVLLRHGSAVQSPEADATPKPALKLATVDTSAGTSTTLNRAPDLTVDALTAEAGDGGPAVDARADVRLATGQSIEDGGGARRISLTSGETEIRNEGGNLAALYRDGSKHELQAYSTTPVSIRDQEGGFTAVQYDTDPSAGVLRTPNAGARVEADGKPSSGEGMQLVYDLSNGFGEISPYDYGTSSFKDLRFRASLYDFSVTPADLRLATGQAIEDESGNSRLRLPSNQTVVDYAEGFAAIEIRNGTHLNLRPNSTTL